MQGEGKNLKDSLNHPIKDTALLPALYQTSVSGFSTYGKTNKLITALYMVTDILDEQEPIRNKLRTLGTDILSDMYSLSELKSIAMSVKTVNKIAEIISFLDIAGAVNIISQMNCSILRKEFVELKNSIEGSINEEHLLNGQMDLAEFFKEDGLFTRFNPKGHDNKSIRHHKPNRIGVQKGSTLMRALSDINSTDVRNNNFDNLKKERREEILAIIKNSPVDSNGAVSATITDIKIKSTGPLVLCSEKTLQRELVSMVGDNVLYKTGSKRWSRYFLPA